MQNKRLRTYQNTFHNLKCCNKRKKQVQENQVFAKTHFPFILMVMISRRKTNKYMKRDEVQRVFLGKHTKCSNYPWTKILDVSQPILSRIKNLQRLSNKKVCFEVFQFPCQVQVLVIFDESFRISYILHIDAYMILLSLGMNTEGLQR